MGNDASKTREERLAAKLRENLRRRKAQAREFDMRGSGENESLLPQTSGENESGRLPKSPRES